MNGSDRVGVRQVGRDTCYFCGSEGPIERHHIVPRRYDGPDEDSNLVDLCPTCHERLERLYDNETWELVEADASDDPGLDRDVGARLVGIIASEIQDTEERVYPTREELKTGLQINGAREDQLRYHITNAQNDGVVVTADEVGNSDDDSEYFYGTGRKVPSSVPLTDLDIPTEFCEYCDEPVLVLETNDDGEPKCHTCGLTRAQQRQVASGETTYEAITASQEDEDRLFKCAKKVIDTVDQSNPDAPGAPQDEARDLACGLLDITEEQFDEWIEGLLTTGDADFHAPEYISLTESINTYAVNGDYDGDVTSPAEKIKGIKDVLRTVDNGCPTEPGAPREEVITTAMLHLGLSVSAIEDEFEKLKTRGDVYPPGDDHIKLV